MFGEYCESNWAAFDKIFNKCKLDQPEVGRYFQKWVVSPTENSCPSIQQDLSHKWTSAHSFKQTAHSGWWCEQWDQCGCACRESVWEMPACWDDRLWLNAFPLLFSPHLILPHFLFFFIHPTFSVCHQCFSCPSFWFCRSPLDCCDHSLDICSLFTPPAATQ